MCVAALKIAKNSQKNAYFGVHGRSSSSTLVPLHGKLVSCAYYDESVSISATVLTLDKLIAGKTISYVGYLLMMPLLTQRHEIWSQKLETEPYHTVKTRSLHLT